MKRIAEERFVGEHYLGLPAAFDDRIIGKRLELVRKVPGFCGDNLDIADIGCGNGAALFELAGEFRKCIGIDVYEGNRAEFEQEKKRRSLSNCEFRLIDLENTPVQPEVDRVICFEVIEHFREEKTAKSLFDILKPGGIAAITVPHKWWVFETHGAKLPLLPWNRVPFFSWLPTPIHEKYANARIYTVPRITKLMESFGFETISTNLIKAPLDVLPESALKRMLLNTVFKGTTTAVPILATSIFLAVRKPTS